MSRGVNRHFRVRACPNAARLMRYLCALVSVLCSNGAAADVVEVFSDELDIFVVPGSLPGRDEGGGLGQAFRAEQDFVVQSIGIQGDIVEQFYDVLIYSGEFIRDGSTNVIEPVSLLASASAVRGGAGAAPHNIPISAFFFAGEHYVVLWRPSDLGVNDWATSIQLWWNPGNSGELETVGPFALCCGRKGTEAELAFWHASFLYDVADCSDDLDNDGDGAKDAADPACPFPALDLENPECDDGVDNDADGLTDMLDDGCVFAADRLESVPFLCSAGLHTRSSALGGMLVALLGFFVLAKRQRWAVS